MPTVYITHVPHHRVERKLVPAINVSPAKAHGEIVVMLPPQTTYMDTKLLMHGLRAELKHYNYEKGDCLLPLGDPVACAAAVAILAVRGRFRILRWDKRLCEYFAATIEV